MKKIAYGVFTNKSRGLPIAIFNSKWHAQGYIDGRPSWRARRMYAQRIWLETADKKVFTVVDHIGYKQEVIEA